MGEKVASTTREPNTNDVKTNRATQKSVREKAMKIFPVVVVTAAIVQQFNFKYSIGNIKAPLDKHIAHIVSQQLLVLTTPLTIFTYHEGVFNFMLPRFLHCLMVALYYIGNTVCVQLYI